MGRLTTAKAKSLSKPGLHGDGGTLYLCVKPSGAKSWIQRVVIDGRRHDIGLGGFPVVSLAKARERAFANRVAVAEGRDPLAEKIKAKQLVHVAPVMRLDHHILSLRLGWSKGYDVRCSFARPEPSDETAPR